MADNWLDELNKQFGSESPVQGLQESMGIVEPPKQGTPAVAEPTPAPTMQQPTAPPVVPAAEPKLNKPQFEAPKEDWLAALNRGEFAPLAPSMPTQPQTPAVAPPVKFGGPKEAISGLLGGMGHTVTTAIPEMVGEAARAPGYLMGGVVPEDRLKEPTIEKPQGTDVGEAFYQAGEMMGPSLAPSAVGAVIGGIFGNVPGAYLGAQIGGQVGAFGFGLSEYTRAKEEGYRKNKELIARGEQPLSDADIEWQAIKRGAIEWGGETLANLALGRMFKAATPLLRLGAKAAKPTLQGVVKPTLKRVALGLPELLGTEVGTEIGQQWGESTVAKESGVNPEAQPWEEAKGVIAPTVIMSLLMAGAGNINARVAYSRSTNALNPSGDRTSMAVREKRSAEALDFLKAINAEVGPESADAWRKVAAMNIAMGEDINMDQSLDVKDLQAEYQAQVDRAQQAMLGPNKQLYKGPEREQGPVVPEQEQWRLNEASLVPPIDVTPKFELEEPGVPFQQPQKSEEKPVSQNEPMDLSHPQGKGEIEVYKFPGFADRDMEQQGLDFHWIESTPVVPFGATQMSLWGTKQEEGGAGPEATPPEPPPLETPEGKAPPTDSTDGGLPPPPPPPTPPTEPTPMGGGEMHPLAKDIPGADTVTIENIGRFRHERQGLSGREQGIAMAINELDVGTGQGLTDQELLDVWYGRKPSELKQQAAPAEDHPLLGGAGVDLYSHVKQIAEETPAHKDVRGIVRDIELAIAESKGTYVVPNNLRMAFEADLQGDVYMPQDARFSVNLREGNESMGSRTFEIERPYGTLIYEERTGIARVEPNDPASLERKKTTMKVKRNQQNTALREANDTISGNLPRAVIFELGQNMSDACREQGGGVMKFELREETAPDGVLETIVTVTDNGKGMTPKEVQDGLLTISGEEKMDKNTAGKFGIAKLAFLGASRRFIVDTMARNKRGRTSHVRLEGTGAQIMQRPGSGQPEAWVEKDFQTDGKEIHGTKIELHFFAEEEAAHAAGTHHAPFFSVRDYIKMFIATMHDDKMRIEFDGQVYAPTGFKDLKQVHDHDHISFDGNEVDIWYVEDLNPVKQYINELHGFKVHAETYSFGLRLLGLPEWRYDHFVWKGEDHPTFKIMINFTKTANTGVDYPFTENRGDLSGRAKQAVENAIFNKLATLNMENYTKTVDAFTQMMNNSPTINGMKVFIPFIDQAEFNKAAEIIAANQDILTELSKMFASFQDLISKIGEKKLQFALTVDPNLHGFRSNPEVTGAEFYAINPFAIIGAFYANPKFKDIIDVGYTAHMAEAGNLIHTFVHEYAHLYAKGHGVDYSTMMMVLYTQLTHMNLAVLERQARRFYETHEERLRSIQGDLSGLGKGGSRFRKDDELVSPTRGEQPGSNRGDQVLEEPKGNTKSLGVVHRLPALVADFLSLPESLRKDLRLARNLNLQLNDVAMPEQNLAKPNERKRAAVNGNVPELFYADSENKQGNPWIRSGRLKDNKTRTLLVQISNELINPLPKDVPLARRYYDMLYSGVRKGYDRPRDFWEIPQWIGVAANSLPQSDVYVVRNVQEAIDFLNKAEYGTVAFSVLDVNKGIIKEILNGYNKGRVALGGYVDLKEEFGLFLNVQTYEKISEFVKDQGEDFIPGTNYRHFQGTEVIPRLVLSNGCLFQCKFCDVSPHGKITEVTSDNIRRQVNSFKALGAKLIYLNDKTFGQASNYIMLAEIYDEMKANDPEFEGFVIQTTASQFLKLNDDFIKHSGIKYVEIGVESYNDDILKKYSKPHTTEQINRAMQKIRENGLVAVPNIIIGMPEETEASYGRTLQFLKDNRDIISHVNAYNLAVYKGTELAEVVKPVNLSDADENKIEKSFHVGGEELHQKFADSIYRFGMEQLSQPSPAQGLPRFAERRGEAELRRLGEAVTGTPMTADQAQEVLDRFMLGLPKGALQGVAVDDINMIPRDVQRAILPTDKAVYDRETGTIYIMAGNHASEQEIMRSVMHELFGHFGIEKLMGKGLNKFYSRVFELYGGEEGLSDIYTAYRLVPGLAEDKLVAAAEKVSQISEDGSNPGLWNEFVLFVKETLNKIFGYDLKLSENDIRVYLKRSRQLLMDEKFRASMQRYADLQQLVKNNAYKLGLPMKRFSMKRTTNKNEISIADMVLNFGEIYSGYKYKDKNFAEQPMRDLGATEAMLSNPFWIAMNHPAFKRMFNVQLDRQDKRNKDTIELLRNPLTNTGDNPYLKAGVNRDTVNKVIVWSDNQGIYLDTDEALQAKARELTGKSLTPDEISAYRGWHDGFKKAIDFIVRRTREIAFKINAKKPWFEQMKQAVEQNLDAKTIIVSADKLEQKEFETAVEYTRQKMDQLAEMEEKLRGIAFYLPRERGRGEYVVRAFVVDGDGKKHAIDVRRFENRTEAEIGRKRMEAAYPDLKVEKTEEKGTPESIYGALNIPVLEAFLQRSMERAQKGEYLNAEQAEIIMKNVINAINDEISARGFKQKYMHRRVGEAIKGYETEHLDKVFVDYMKGLAGSLSKLEASFDFHDALTDIHKSGQRELYEYATRYMNDMMRNPDSLDRKINALKTIPYAWYLAANLRMVPVQMTQNFVTAIPIMSRLMKEAGVKGSASSYIMKAMKDVATSNFSTEEKRMLDEAWEKGETMANYLQQIKGKIEGSWAKNVFQKTLDVFSIPFAGMERFNRKAAYLAAYRMYSKAGMAHEEAFSSAREFVNMSHYAYGPGNMPQVLRDGTAAGKIMGLGYVFQSFRHNYLLSLKHFIKKKDDKIALDMMMRSLAFLVLFGGLGAFPFLDDILEEAEKMFGTPYRSQMRKAMKNVGGELLADAGMQGLPALLGFDLSGSLKISLPIPGVGGPLQDSIFGVWGGLIDKGKQAIDSGLNGDYARMVEAMSPSGFEVMLKAARISKEGIRTASGKPILDEKGRPIKPTTTESIGQAMGFRPARMAEVSQERRVSSNVQEHYSKKKQDIYKRLRTAKDAAQLAELRRDIQKFNLDVQKFKGLIAPINLTSMKQAMKPEEGYMEYKRKGNF